MNKNKDRNSHMEGNNRKDENNHMEENNHMYDNNHMDENNRIDSFKGTPVRMVLDNTLRGYRIHMGDYCETKQRIILDASGKLTLLGCSDGVELDEGPFLRRVEKVVTRGFAETFLGLLTEYLKQNYRGFSSYLTEIAPWSLRIYNDSGEVYEYYDYSIDRGYEYFNVILRIMLGTKLVACFDPYTKWYDIEEYESERVKGMLDTLEEKINK